MPKSLVRITAGSYEQLRDLDKYNLDLKKRTAREEDDNRFVVVGILSEQQIEQVRSAGYTVEILSDLSQMGRERISEVSRKNRISSSNRVGVLITGSMHAREWGGSDICINFLVKLIDAYLNNTTLIYGETTFPPQQLKNMLERIDLFVFPDVNPDGKIYSQTNDDPNLS